MHPVGSLMFTSIKRKLILMLMKYLSKGDVSSIKILQADDPINHRDNLRGFLHSHPMMQSRLNIPSGHVVVDEKDWKKARFDHLLRENSQRIFWSTEI